MLFTSLVIAIHIYIVLLEMFLWTKPTGLKAFRQSLEKAQSTAVLAKNQGLYNGFLVAGLIWSIVEPRAEFASSIQIFFLSCVVVAGIYGGYTVNKKIFLIQAVPALLALTCVLVTCCA